MKLNIYSVHVRPEDGERPEDVVFVREGFSFWAFVFQPLWALYHRLWLVAVLLFVVGIGIEFLVRTLGIGGVGPYALALGVAILIGTEAANLRRWTLTRRGYEEVAVAVGSDLGEAEQRYFGDRLGTGFAA
ncbi:MAG: DUF2628 domain-containing protein [Sphingomonadales bacterium]